MKILMFGTPITMEEANNLSSFDYSILYLNSSDRKLKIASADYEGYYCDNNEIHEAFKSDAIMLLKHVKRSDIKRTKNIIELIINDEREVEKVTSNSNFRKKTPVLNGIVLAKRLK